MSKNPQMPRGPVDQVEGGPPLQVEGVGPDVYDLVHPAPPPQGAYAHPQGAASLPVSPSFDAELRELMARPTPGVDDAANLAVVDRLANHMGGKR